MPSTDRFSRTSMKTRAASTSTPAPPATTSAIPDAGAPARPLAITTRVATQAASTAMTVAAAELDVRRAQLGPEPFGHPPRRRAEQQRREHRHQLARDAQVAAEHPLAHGQRVADGDGEQGQVGQRDPPPGAW